MINIFLLFYTYTLCKWPNVYRIQIRRVLASEYHEPQSVNLETPPSPEQDYFCSIYDLRRHTTSGCLVWIHSFKARIKLHTKQHDEGSKVAHMFANRSNFIWHVLMCKQEEHTFPYTFQGCGKTFTTARYVKEHTKNHLALTYKCPICTAALPLISKTLLHTH